MTTEVLRNREARRLYPANRRAFFGGMALLMLATVLLGFAKTYFLAGMVRAPLPGLMVHIHGAFFTLWILLFLVQAALVSLKKVHWHRQLGLATFLIAPVMAVLGVLVTIGLVQRTPPDPGFDLRAASIIGFANMAMFLALVAASYITRRRPDAHKRLVLYATIILLSAAINRWPFAAWGMGDQWADWIFYGYLLLPGVYDLFALHRLHRVTMWVVPSVFAVIALKGPLGRTQGWHFLIDLMTKHL